MRSCSISLFGLKLIGFLRVANALEHVMNDTLGPVGVTAAERFHVGHVDDVQDVTGFDDEKFQVVLVAPVGQLGKPILFRAEFRVQIVQLQRRALERAEQRREHGHLYCDRQK